MRAARGSKRRRGRESWELAVRIDGKRYTKTIHATTDEEAEDALLDYRRELRDEGVPDRDPTVRESSEEWLQVVRGRVKERTATRYEQLLRVHVWPVIGYVRRRKLPPGDVRRVIDRVLHAISAYQPPCVPAAAEYLAETERWGLGPNVAKLVRPTAARTAGAADPDRRGDARDGRRCPRLDRRGTDDSGRRLRPAGG